jgi:eukaryotic-like serine/threonine-protein kinase
MGVRTQTVPRALADAGLPDRYRLIRLIARGGMATVWCAEDLMLGRRVALKLLADQFVDDDRAVRRFMREARTAGRLSGHPNIITIFDVGRTNPDAEGTPSRPFIVMEHLPGGSVADAIRVHEVRGDDPLRWLRDAAAALDYAHEQGVIHRDIKPGNMLLDSQRGLHVGDFGIARIATEDTITRGGTLFGTAAYVAPEQALGQRATEASDRYALAVVAFELLTGERPFRGEHFAAQARQHIEEEPPRASSVSPSLPPAVDDVLLRGLAKRPEDRWPSAAAFADAVSAAVRPRPIRRRADPPPVVRTATSRRRPRGVALAALAAGSLIIGAAVGASHGDRAPRTTAASIHAARHTTTSATNKPKHHTRHHTSVPAHPAAATTSSAGSSADTSSTATASTPSGGSPDALEARGHALMMAGQYAQAIGVLRQAVASAPHSSLTYAYALYDLGRSLRLAGDSRAAIPILQARLQIPNQTDVVRHELQLALQAAGASSGGAGPAATPPANSGGAAAAPPGHGGKHPGKGKDKHGGG